MGISWTGARAVEFVFLLFLLWACVGPVLWGVLSPVFLCVFLCGVSVAFLAGFCVWPVCVPGWWLCVVWRFCVVSLCPLWLLIKFMFQKNNNMFINKF